ncbi:protein kinase [Microcoleus sp. ZQ-A2]|nr:serine/threonine protein kinase [Microcoleus sp. FACHB-1]
MLGITLSGRYKIVQHLGGGGFGQTYLAQDLQLPGNPLCVVKQLKPQSTDPITLQTAKRLFDREAQVLYKLGNHNHIPRLLAHLEQEQEFYLVQEYIEGHDLKQELPRGKRFSEAQVIALCQELLTILEFVHQQEVIHRDIKPANIVRRKLDGKLVLIDFGAVKEVATQTVNSEGHTTLTVAIGSPGYMPSEQLRGKPQFCSDIYAVGMLCIQALTGLPPNQLPEDPKTSEIIWRDQWQHNTPPEQVQASHKLADVLDTMVRYDYRQRYQTAAEALQVLTSLTPSNSSPTTISASQVIFTASANPSESTATYSAPSPISDSPADSPIEMVEPTQAPPSQQQRTPDASVNLLQEKVGNETWARLVATSRNKSYKLFGMGAAITTAVALTVGIYYFHGLTLSATENQWSQKMSLSKTLTGDSNSTNPVAITPDGKTLATGSEEGTIKFWNLQTGELKKTFKGHTSAVNVIVFSPNGQTLASGSADESIKLWNLNTEGVLHTLSGRSKGISAIVMTPDSQTLVSGDRVGNIEFWNLKNGERINAFAGHEILVTSLAVTPDGQTIVSSSQDNRIKLWDVKTGQLIRTLTAADSHHFFSVAISPNGQQIASGSWDGGIRLWDVKTGNLTQILKTDSAPIDTVVFKANGQTLVSGSADGSIRMWDLKTNKLRRTLSGHSEAVNRMVMTPDGQMLVSSGKDKAIKIWRSP